jgi:hypothetical protein
LGCDLVVVHGGFAIFFVNFERITKFGKGVVQELSGVSEDEITILEDFSANSHAHNSTFFNHILAFDVWDIQVEERIKIG